MADIKFNSLGYNRAEVDQVIDRSFEEFGKSTVETSKTVDQFFLDYEDLFYQIPLTGENSHQSLMEKSGAMCEGINSALEDIQPLIDEITTLRSQLVESQKTILELQTQLKQAGVTT